MSTLPLKLLLLLLVLLSQSYTSKAKAQARKDMTLIHSTCKRTRSYKQCVKYLSSDPRSYNADTAGLAKIALEIALKDTNNLFQLSLSWRKKKNLNDKTIRALETCTELYGDAIDGLTVAVQALNSNDYKTAKLQAGQAIKAADTCKQEFEEFDQKMPLAKKNEALNQLSTAALDLVSLL